MINKYRIRILTTLMLILPLLAQSASVKIISDAYENKVEVGETFHITIEAENCGGSISMSQKPPGLKVVYHTTRSMTSQSVHGGKQVTNSTTSLILTCKGQDVGQYSFGPVSVNGVKSNTITYKVVPSTGKSRQPQQQSQNGAGNGADPFGNNANKGPLFVGNGNEEMFLRASVNKSKAYEQEAIEYTVTLYTTYGDIKFLGATAAPKFDGFVTEESNEVSHAFRFEDYKGKTFKTAVIARYIIFPQKAGHLKIKGNTYTVSTDARQYYHDPYFQTMTVKYPVQLNVTPNDIEIDVEALPQPIPSNFIGGVGSFRMSTQISSTQLATNQAASLKYIVEGTGNIKYLKMPELAPYFPASIETFTPDVAVDDKIGASNVSGSATFDYSIMAHEEGKFRIPEIEFSYFNPEKRAYETLHSRDIEIEVSQGQESSKSQQAKTFNPALLPMGRIMAGDEGPYVGTIFYWLWFAAPAVIFILILALYRKYMKDHEDLDALRSKKANKIALKRLNKAYKCIKNHQDKQFYDEMLTALWGYIGDKLKMPTSLLNRGNVSEEFAKHGVQQATFQPIINIIDDCEYAKYTPVARDDNMQQLYADALLAISKIENEYTHSPKSRNAGEDEDEDNDDTDNDHENKK